MYTEKHVIPLLLKACPGWNEVLNKARTNRGDEKPGLAMYIEITVLAQYIVDSYKTGATGEFPKLFKTLEIIIQEGNEKAKELVMVGLIEDIQSISAKEPFDGRIFKQWLGEESLVAWNYVEKLWEKEDINKNE